MRASPQGHEHPELLPAMRLVFPDLPDDTEFVFTQNNPFYLGGIGTFAHDPTKVDLLPYEVEVPQPDKTSLTLKVTAGTYKFGIKVYVVIFKVDVTGFENAYFTLESKDAKTTPPA